MSMYSTINFIIFISNKRTPVLDPIVFYRIHNSYLINLAQLININKRAGNYCEMSNGDSLPLSRRRYEGLMGYMRNR
jgi:two-component system LytT family response regulator